MVKTIKTGNEVYGMISIKLTLIIIVQMYIHTYYSIFHIFNLGEIGDSTLLGNEILADGKQSTCSECGQVKKMVDDSEDSKIS